MSLETWNNKLRLYQSELYIESVSVCCNSKITGWAASSYDLLHAGHVLYLQQAKERCEVLIAALQIDPTLDRPQKNKPIQSEVERLIQLDAVKFVDYIVVYNSEDEHRKLIRKFKPIIFKGSDHQGKMIVEDEGICQIIYLERENPWASSELRQRIKNSS